MVEMKDNAFENFACTAWWYKRDANLRKNFAIMENGNSRDEWNGSRTMYFFTADL